MCISGMCGLGLLMGKFLSIFDRVICPQGFVYLFPKNNHSKYLLAFTKLGICIDIVEIWFGISIRQISSIFDRVTAGDMIVFHVFYFLLFLHFHSCSSFFPVPLFHLFCYLFRLFSPFLWETTQNDPQGLTCR